MIGHPTNFFMSSRILCQGCMLSHFLSVINIVVSLSQNLEQEREVGNLLGITMVSGIKELNHSDFLEWESLGKCK